MNNSSENPTSVTISSFPDYVAAHYTYSEVMEANESDTGAAAEEVREDVSKILRYFREALPDETITKALERFISQYSAGQDLDERMGARGFGVECELGGYMFEDIYRSVTPKMRDTIESFIEKHGPVDIGDLTRDRQYLITLAEKIKQDVGLDEDVITSLFGELVDDHSFNIYDSSEFLGHLKRFFEDCPCFLDSGLSRSDFLRQVFREERDVADFFGEF